MPRCTVVFLAAIIFQVLLGALTKHAVGKVNPCKDFPSYAGKVKKSTEGLYISSESDRMQLKDFIQNYSLKAKELSEIEKNFYKFRNQCSETTVEDKKNFLRKFNLSFGGWPAFNKNWKSDKFDLQVAIAELQSFHYPAVFMIRLTNEFDSFVNQIEVKLIMWDMLQVDQFNQLIREKLSDITDNVDEVLSDSDAVEALYIAEQNYTDATVLTDYKGLKEEIPEIDWDMQFEVIYGQQVPDSFPVKIYQLGLLKRVIPKLFKVEPKIMANYLLYRFAYGLLDLNEDIILELFENVLYQMMMKQRYTGETKEELRDMLTSFLKTLGNSVNLFNDEDKFNAEKAINEFVMDEILPDIDDSYSDKFYGKITVSEGDCYSTGAEMVSTYFKLQGKIFFKRKVDPFHLMRSGLVNTIMYKLPSFLEKSSAIKFEVLIWDALRIHLLMYWEPEKFKTMQQCLKKRTRERFNEYEVKQAFQFQIFTKAYSDWTKDNTDLMLLEEEKYNENSKKIFLERLIARYYDSGFGQEKSKISGVFANLEMVPEIYNCPIGSPLNPQSKCKIV